MNSSYPVHIEMVERLTEIQLTELCSVSDCTGEVGVAPGGTLILRVAAIPLSSKYCVSKKFGPFYVVSY